MHLKYKIHSVETTVNEFNTKRKQIGSSVQLGLKKSSELKK